MIIREVIETAEKNMLCDYACHSLSSRGRLIAEKACPVRTIFQVDRDRILHSKAFRRLKYKTQVFLSPEGDHYRTRLTHTLEVSQVARTIARALRLNEDLTEAMAAVGLERGEEGVGAAGAGQDASDAQRPRPRPGRPRPVVGHLRQCRRRPEGGGVSGRGRALYLSRQPAA